ncbi:MAG: hypothetical protein ACJ74U_15020 [Jatrophihabitantaceae bacterium]
MREPETGVAVNLSARAGSGPGEGIRVHMSSVIGGSLNRTAWLLVTAAGAPV